MYSLMIELELYGLEPKTILLRFKTGTRSEIDALTFSYQKQEDFLYQHKDKLLKNLWKEKEKYGITLPPSDISLGCTGIYLENEDKKIAPLFQTITVQKQIVNTNEYAYKRLLEGRIFPLLEADKNNQKLNIPSIFLDFYEFCEYLELWGIILNEELTELWKIWQTESYFYEILRFILSKSTELDMQVFKKSVKEKESINRQKKYWYDED